MVNYVKEDIESPKTYQLITTVMSLSKGGVEVPTVGEPYGELMTRQQAEYMAAQMTNTTYFNIEGA